MKRFLIVLVVVLVLGAVAALTSMNSIVVAAVEKAGTAALGVETELDDADIGLMSAEARLTGLVIDNPEGFGDASFLELGRAVFDLRAPTLFEDVIRIPLIELESTRLSIVQKGSASNVATILANLESGADDPVGSEEEEASGGGGKRFHVERIALKEIAVDVSVDLLGDGSNVTTASLVIPEVLIEGVGTSEEGAPLQEIVGEVVKAMLAATLEADGGSILDGTLRRTLEDGLAGLKEKGRGAIDDARERVDEVIEDVDSKIDDALDDAKKGLEDKAGELLKGIGGKKD